jgi:signal transduction histidine kinase
VQWVRGSFARAGGARWLGPLLALAVGLAQGGLLGALPGQIAVWTFFGGGAIFVQPPHSWLGVPFAGGAVLAAAFTWSPLHRGPILVEIGCVCLAWVTAALLHGVAKDSLRLASARQSLTLLGVQAVLPLGVAVAIRSVLGRSLSAVPDVPAGFGNSGVFLLGLLSYIGLGPLVWPFIERPLSVWQPRRVTLAPAFALGMLPLVTLGLPALGIVGGPPPLPPAFTLGTLCVSACALAAMLLRASTQASHVEYLVNLRTRQLEKARNEAEEAARAKSEFLANMSHEIRTPMNGVLGVAELLGDTPLNDEQKGLVRVIRQSGDALLTVINEILDFSKLEAGKVEVRSEPFDPRKLIGEVAALLLERAHDRGLTLEGEVDPGVPSTLVGDAGRIRQILINLVGNGIKFTERGSVRVRIGLSDSCAEENRAPTEVCLRFSVIDTGNGITPEDQARLFQAFNQLDNSTRRTHEGTGLGLAICRRLAELMGGSMHLSSEPGAGSHFWCQLRLGVGQATEVNLPEQTPLASARELLGRVLIVDDNGVNRRIASKMVASFGVETVLAENGSEAVDAVKAQHFDLVLMDCHMPVMDGFEAARTITNQLEGVPPPIVALSASAMPEDVARCLESGMSAHLSKPISKAALEATLQRYLRPVA